MDSVGEKKNDKLKFCLEVAFSWWVIFVLVFLAFVLHCSMCIVYGIDKVW